MTEHKYFRIRKYFLSENRWFRTSRKRTRLSHDVWNYYYPLDNIKEEEVIHHINGDSSNDHITNLKKMNGNEHHSLHSKKDSNGNWKGGISIDKNDYIRKYSKQNYIQKSLFNLYDNRDHFYLSVCLKYNRKTNHIIIFTEWCMYDHQKGG